MTLFRLHVFRLQTWRKSLITYLRSAYSTLYRKQQPHLLPQSKMSSNTALPPPPKGRGPSKKQNSIDPSRGSLWLKPSRPSIMRGHHPAVAPWHMPNAAYGPQGRYDQMNATAWDQYQEAWEATSRPESTAQQPPVPTRPRAMHARQMGAPSGFRPGLESPFEALGKIVPSHGLSPLPFEEPVPYCRWCTVLFSRVKAPCAFTADGKHSWKYSVTGESFVAPLDPWQHPGEQVPLPKLTCADLRRARLDIKYLWPTEERFVKPELPTMDDCYLGALPASSPVPAGLSGEVEPVVDHQEEKPLPSLKADPPLAPLQDRRLQAVRDETPSLVGPRKSRTPVQVRLPPPEASPAPLALIPSTPGPATPSPPGASQGSPLNPVATEFRPAQSSPLAEHPMGHQRRQSALPAPFGRVQFGNAPHQEPAGVDFAASQSAGASQGGHQRAQSIGVMITDRKRGVRRKERNRNRTPFWMAAGKK